VADINTIQAALATQINARTGLRMLAQARDQVSPPIGVVLPGNPLAVYGNTMDGTVTFNFGILLVISDAQPNEKTQRALNAYLGIGIGEVESIPAALMFDNTLGGAVHWAIPINISNYARIEYAGVPYFGARLNISVGAI
jgi:hypothetical protein